MFRITFLAVAFAASLSTALQAQDKQPLRPEPYLIDQFFPQSASLKKGYFITEGQLEKLSSEARTEFEKLLKAKADQPARVKIYEQKVREEYQRIQDELTKAIGEQQKAAAEQQRFRYMIGVGVEPKRDRGVVVTKVVEDSPAAAAGIARGDRILSVKGTRTISHPGDLIDAVEASRGKELVLIVRRPGKDGEEKRVKVVPVERGERLDTVILKDKQSDGVLDLRLSTIHPGIYYWKQSALQHNLPENVTISVSKTGKEPAKITVKRGDESWDISEGELDRLPEDLRDEVQRLLPGPGGHLRSSGKRLDLRPGTPDATKAKALKLKKAVDNQFKEKQALRDTQLERIQKQLEDLRKAVEKLQQDQES